MKRPVTILYTGGTIGMVPGPEGLVPDPDFEQALRAALPDEPFAWRQLPDLLDSSAMAPADWLRIRDAVCEIDGAVVVLHGTDTMAWTASALAFLLTGHDAPVVLTGAQVPLQSGGSDAPGNVRLALEVARFADGLALIAFGGRVLRGARALKTHAQSFEAFSAPNDPDFDWQGATTPASVPGGDMLRVGVLRLFPGIGGAAVAAFADLPGLVIEAFGSGNLPGGAFEEALADARAAGQEIAIVTQCEAGHVMAETYAAGSAVARLGLIPCADMTTPAAATKLGWLLARGLTGMDLRHAMLTPVAGEMTR